VPPLDDRYDVRNGMPNINDTIDGWCVADHGLESQ
jgi:hypothetical protein